MNIPSSGITADVIRESMPPYHFSADLLEATFAALPPPPPDATSAWRAARITRLIQEISSMMPANASQARTAADTLILRELACAIALRAHDPQLTALQMGRMGRTAAEMERSAEGLRRGLERTQQKPAPFFGTVLADEVDVAAVDAVWGTRAVQPAAEDAAGKSRDPRVKRPGTGVGAGAAAAGMAGTAPETDVQGRDLPAVAPAGTNASSSDGPGVAEAESGDRSAVTEAGSGDSAAVTPAQDRPADAATCPATFPGPDGDPTPQAVVTRLREGRGWTLDVVRPRTVAAAGDAAGGAAGDAAGDVAGDNVVPGSGA